MVRDYAGMVPHPVQAGVDVGGAPPTMATIEPSLVRRTVPSSTPAPRGLNLLNVAAFGLLIGYGWRSKDLLLRRVFLASVAVVFPLFLAFGFHDELRVFAIAFPALFLLASETVPALYSRTGYSSSESS